MIKSHVFLNPFVKKNASIAWPIALNGLLMQSMLMVDTLIVAPLGEVSLAGMGIASTLIAFILGIQFALSNGTQLVVGRAFGATSQYALSMAFYAGLAINVISAFVFFMGLATFSEGLIAWLTQDQKLAEQALIYLSISQYMVLVTASTQVCTAFFNGTGQSNIPLKGYLFELPINAVISYLLVFGWQLPDIELFSLFNLNDLGFEGKGLAGAAVGSLIAVCLRCVYLLWQMKGQFRLTVNNHLSSFIDECKRHFVEIYPIAANYIILAVGATVYLLLFSQLSIYSYAAVTLIFPWIRIGAQFVNSWAHASAICISQAIGKNQTYQIKYMIISSVAIAMVGALITAIAFYLLSISIHFIYPDIASETYIALSSIAPLYIFLPIVKTYNALAGNVLRALGKSLTVLKIHFITQWFIVLPACSMMILYFKLPLYWAFSLLVIEELIKFIPFYKTLKLMRK